jgi:hypothetical protein
MEELTEKEIEDILKQRGFQGSEEDFHIAAVQLKEEIKLHSRENFVEIYSRAGLY